MKPILTLYMLLIVTVLAACSDSTTSAPPAPLPPVEPPVTDSYITVGTPIQDFIAVTAAIATVAPDYSSGAHSIVQGDDQGNFTALNNLLPTGSDITIAASGGSFYRIGRLGAGNNITRFDFAEPQTPLWQYSTNDGVASAVASNPYDILVVSDTKAYVLRYDSDTVWIVNPSAGSEAGFKIGELDLSAYGGDDGIPDMGAAVIADGRLFIALQRLEGGRLQVSQDAYVAVFDIATDTEIDAGITGDSLKGIPLQVRNPTGLIYHTDSQRIFVQGSGSFFPLEFTGGIETIDINSYATTLVLDDSDQFGLITALQPVSADVLYFVGYQNYDDTTLYVMDIQSGRVLPTKVAALMQTQISDLALDPQGLLWVGDTAQATVRIIDPASGDEIAAVSTNLNPDKIVFAQ